MTALMQDVPGLADAKARLAVARNRRTALTSRLAAAEDACERARSAREEIIARIAAGADLPVAATSDAAAAVTVAENHAVALREAMAGADAAIKAADREVKAVLREALRKVLLPMRKEVAELAAAREAAAAKHNDASMQLQRIETAFLSGDASAHEFLLTGRAG